MSLVCALLQYPWLDSTPAQSVYHPTTSVNPLDPLNFSFPVLPSSADVFSADNQSEPVSTLLETEQFAHPQVVKRQLSSVDTLLHGYQHTVYDYTIFVAHGQVSEKLTGAVLSANPDGCLQKYRRPRLPVIQQPLSRENYKEKFQALLSSEESSHSTILEEKSVIIIFMA